MVPAVTKYPPGTQPSGFSGLLYQKDLCIPFSNETVYIYSMRQKKLSRPGRAGTCFFCPSQRRALNYTACANGACILSFLIDTFVVFLVRLRSNKS